MALLKMRTKRVLRDVHKMYVMILLPIVFLATGIILNKLSHEVQPIRSIALNNSTCFKQFVQYVVFENIVTVNHQTIWSELF